MANQQVPMVMEEVTDPEELAKARMQRARFDRNSAWLQAHAKEVDTGADRTVFSAATLSKLGLQPIVVQERLGGLGGLINAVEVATQIQLTRETGNKVVFRSQYAAVTAVEALDICVLGRDITGLFT